MSVYTISADFLRSMNVHIHSKYVMDVLFHFSQTHNSSKVAIDGKDRVMNLYQKIVEGKKDGSEILKYWLDFIADKGVYDVVNVELDCIDCEETLFLTLCKSTKNQQKIIIFSHDNLQKYHSDGTKLMFEGVELTVLDRDEAVKELRSVTEGAQIIVQGNYYHNCQIATGLSIISKSKNN